jgi:hypothetical protein
VDVGDQRDIDPVAELTARLDVFLLGHGHADQLAAGLLQEADLRQRRRDVEGIGRRHRLDPDRVVAADDVVPQADLARLVPGHRRAIGHWSPS